MFPSVLMSNSTSLSEEASCVSSGTRVQDFGRLDPMVSTVSPHQPQKIKKKRNLPGNPDPDAEVIALSPKTLMATNRFVCEICNKGFQRDQNLQLHRRGHNLPWKLKQRNSKEIKKKAYVCPEPTCIHHHPSRALGDLTGIKKHFCRKHGEKKWKCGKCSKIYAVQSDWKAHSKTCGTREYRCDCGILFSRKDTFITHRAFCDALAEESARLLPSAANPNPNPILPTSTNPTAPPQPFPFLTHPQNFLNPWDPPHNPNTQNPFHIKPEIIHLPISSPLFYQDPPPHLHVSTQSTSAHLSATALLQKAATLGSHSVGHVPSTMTQLDMGEFGNAGRVRTRMSPEYLGLTRDFLGLAGEQCSSGGKGNNVNVNVKVRNVVSFTGGAEYPTICERDHSLLKAQDFGFVECASETWRNC